MVTTPAYKPIFEHFPMNHFINTLTQAMYSKDDQ